VWSEARKNIGITHTTIAGVRVGMCIRVPTLTMGWYVRNLQSSCRTCLWLIGHCRILTRSRNDVGDELGGEGEDENMGVLE
jgi:hypothetical protein